MEGQAKILIITFPCPGSERDSYNQDFKHILDYVSANYFQFGIVCEATYGLETADFPLVLKYYNAVA